MEVLREKVYWKSPTSVVIEKRICLEKKFKNLHSDNPKAEGLIENVYQKYASSMAIQNMYQKSATSVANQKQSFLQK